MFTLRSSIVMLAVCCALAATPAFAAAPATQPSPDVVTQQVEVTMGILRQVQGVRLENGSAVIDIKDAKKGTHPIVVQFAGAMKSATPTGSAAAGAQSRSDTGMSLLGWKLPFKLPLAQIGAFFLALAALRRGVDNVRRLIPARAIAAVRRRFVDDPLSS